MMMMMIMMMMIMMMISLYRPYPLHVYRPSCIAYTCEHAGHKMVLNDSSSVKCLN